MRKENLSGLESRPQELVGGEVASECGRGGGVRGGGEARKSGSVDLGWMVSPSLPVNSATAATPSTSVTPTHSATNPCVPSSLPSSLSFSLSCVFDLLVYKKRKMKEMCK